MPTWAKVAGVAAGVAVIVGGGVVVMRSVNVLWQGNPRWGGEQLGDGTSDIANGGCLLSLLTMARNTLIGGDMKPDEANRILKAARAFSPGTSLLNVEKACPALGLRLVKRERQVLDSAGRIVSTPTLAALRAVVDPGLKAGLAVLQVDHNGDGKGDHFVLIQGRAADGTYVAADPSPGKSVPLNRYLGGVVAWGSRDKLYAPVGAFSVVGA